MATLYKNIGGNHTTGDGTVVPSGGQFVDADDDLRSKFVGKFEVISKVDGPEPQPTVDPTDPPKTDPGEKKPGTDHLQEAGADVTAEYPNAVKAGLRVVKTKAGLTVYDTEGEAINDEPLGKKKDVNDVINEWTE